MSSQNRPNVIVYFTDSQRWDCSSLHGNPLDLMPTFDRYAIRGAHLFNAFSPQPVCTPARACFQTGKYGTQSGVYRNGLGLRRDERTLAHWFGDAGYDTAYIGKWHLAGGSGAGDAHGHVPEESRGGYRYWLAANTLEMVSEPYRCVVYDSQGKEQVLPGYRVDALTDAAIRCIDAPRAKPIYLFLSQLEPHSQNHLGSFVAPEGYRERYTSRWTPPDLLGLPPLAGDVMTLGERAQHGLADYWGMVRRIDESLQRLMDTLKSKRILDNTIVVFTSDHGTHFNTRNRAGKCSPHESSIRVPTAIWGDRFNGGGRVEELVSLLDLPPTLLDACGIPVPEQMVGHSLLPLLRGDRGGWQEEVFIQVSQTEVGRYVRTKRWKYGATAPDANAWNDAGAGRYVESCLFDMENDPYELINLIGLESHRRVATRMRERLLRRMKEAGELLPVVEDAPSRKSNQRGVDEREVNA